MDAWNFDGSLLQLDGFGGIGSTVTISWGAVGSPEPAAAVDDLRLTPGRPNPFGRGLVTDFALPRRANVLLEVLDVTGRRVRILVDEPREAGIHRVEWDGRDALRTIRLGRRLLPARDVDGQVAVHESGQAALERSFPVVLGWNFPPRPGAER